MDPNMEKVFYAFVGGMLNLRDRIEEHKTEIKQAHEHNEESARAFIDGLAQRGEEEKAALRESLTEMLKEVVNDLGLATKEDIAALKKELRGD